MHGTGADCKLSNTQMFQGLSSEGGKSKSPHVQWSVRIVQELLSFFLGNEVEDNSYTIL